MYLLWVRYSAMVTVGDEGLQVVSLVTMKDAVDGVVTGDIFYLTSTEVIT